MSSQELVQLCVGVRSRRVVACGVVVGVSTVGVGSVVVGCHYSLVQGAGS